MAGAVARDSRAHNLTQNMYRQGTVQRVWRSGMAALPEADPLSVCGFPELRKQHQRHVRGMGKGRRLVILCHDIWGNVVLRPRPCMN